MTVRVTFEKLCCAGEKDIRAVQRLAKWLKVPGAQSEHVGGLATRIDARIRALEAADYRKGHR